ncbi:MAG: photosystem I reaction center subunit PsaK [Prochlorococcus sp. SP3034]|nr:photosystem I reaction center subunit PsaK [Prochlorococcus sp. SP3034]|tara:strand:- start:464 stop:727 length:264 start_codon:yes stop_codon:yes gene_type:complete
MIYTIFAAANAPATFEWSPKCALVMISCNILAYAIARATIQKPNEGFAIPNAKFFGGLSHASFVGANCLGHIIGIGTILGLASRGVL